MESNKQLVSIICLILALFIPSLGWAQEPEVLYIGSTPDGTNILQHIIKDGEQDAEFISDQYKKVFNIYLDPHDITRRNGYKRNEQLGPVGVRIFLFTSKAITPDIPRDFPVGQHIELHEVKEGQTLFSIKTMNYPQGGVNMSDIKKWNDLNEVDDIDIGMWLLMYKEGELDRVKEEKLEEEIEEVTQVADVQQVEAQDVDIQEEAPDPPVQPINQEAKISLLGHYNGMHIIQHTIEQGSQNPDFLAGLYNAMGIFVTSNQIRRWNGYQPGEIPEVGTKVFLFTRNEVPAHIPEYTPYPSKMLVTHLVDRNQNLESILRDYYGDKPAVTVQDIVKWNDLVDENDVREGMYMLLYVNKRGTVSTINDYTSYLADSMGMKIKVIGETSDGMTVISHVVQPNATDAETVFKQYITLGIPIKKQDILKRNGYGYAEAMDQGIRIFLYTDQKVAKGIERDKVPDGKKLAIHEVVQGQTLYSIWKQYYANDPKVDIQMLVKWNDLYDVNDINIDQYILLYLPKEEPAAEVPIKAVVLGKTEAGDYVIEHTVQKGALNPETMAEQYKKMGLEVTGNDLRRWNGYRRGEEVAEGTKIFLVTREEPPTDLPREDRVPGKTIYLHNVNYSESLLSIRNTYYPQKDVSLDEIVKWNDLTGTHDVNYEQKIVLYVKEQ